jgi:hypothetical protein
VKAAKLMFGHDLNNLLLGFNDESDVPISESNWAGLIINTTEKACNFVQCYAFLLFAKQDTGGTRGHGGECDSQDKHSRNQAFLLKATR